MLSFLFKLFFTHFAYFLSFLATIKNTFLPLLVHLLCTVCLHYLLQHLWSLLFPEYFWHTLLGVHLCGKFIPPIFAAYFVLYLMFQFHNLCFPVFATHFLLHIKIWTFCGLHVELHNLCWTFNIAHFMLFTCCWKLKLKILCCLFYAVLWCCTYCSAHFVLHI